MKCALVSLLLGAAGAAQETTAPARGEPRPLDSAIVEVTVPGNATREVTWEVRPAGTI